MEQTLDVEPGDAGLSPALSLTGGLRASLTCAPGTNTSLRVAIARAPPPGYFRGSAFLQGPHPGIPRGPLHELQGLTLQAPRISSCPPPLLLLTRVMGPFAANVQSGSVASHAR